TNDNPRTEDPLEIIREIEKGIKDLGKTNYSVIPDRKEAINYAVNMAQKNDIILIAGKGHENYQIIGKEKFVFSDKETVIEAINSKKKKEKK
ncbi:MAG: glutamate ligase domain-containing protein, partial [Elusimicrobiales bacterium]